MGMRRGKRRPTPTIWRRRGPWPLYRHCERSDQLGPSRFVPTRQELFGLVWDRLTSSSTSGVVSVPQLFAHASEPLATLEVHVEALGAIAFPEDEMAEAKRDKKSKGEQEQQLSKELEQTFPASDPPASVQPGSGVTGPEVAKPKPKDN